MTNLVKLKQFLRVPLFWWEYLETSSFPDHLQSLEDIVEFGKRHKVMGFNRECIRAYILWRVFEHFGCTSFVETGTGYGPTASFVHCAFKTAVFTCEVNTSNYFISRLNLLWARRLLVSRSNSPDFLREVGHSSLIGNMPMFYLDAHWNKYMPLHDELRIIAGCCETGVLVIDDFFVPPNQNSGNKYAGSPKINVNAISKVLKTLGKDALIYLPAYDPSREPRGGATGMAIVVMGHGKELPSQTFPFNLLTLAVAP